MIMGLEQARKPMYIGLHDVARAVLKILEKCSVCSTDHVARLYSYTTRPGHRAWTVLEHLRRRGFIESHRTSLVEPAVHRLVREVRVKHHLPLVKWNGRLRHRLEITDVYMDLQRPDDFIAEPRIPFMWGSDYHVLSPDIYTMGMFIEVQISPMKSEQWARKRMLYERYFSGLSEPQPKVIIIQSHNQQHSTIGTALNYDLQIVHHISEVIPWAGSDSCSVGRQNL